MSKQEPLPATGVPPLEQARRRAGRVLWIEQLWPAVLPALGLVGLLALLSLLTLPQRLPAWLHAVLLLGFAAGTLWLLRRGVRPLVSPTRGDRDDRIEQASRLRHRPLSTLADRPALAGTPGDAASLLWQAHLERTRAGLHRLSAGGPGLALRPAERRLGVALLAALVLALGLAGRDAPLRLASGLWPGLEIPLGARPALEAWITPPDYAGGAPIFLTDPVGRYEIPAGARLSVSLVGAGGRPSIAGARTAGFTRLSTQSWSLEQVLSASSRITIRSAGYRMADWTIVVATAAGPRVSWTTPPGPATDEPWHTRLPWSVAQRYGVRGLTAELRLAAGGDRVLRVPIPLPGTPTDTKGVALPDLAADPWAGEAVTARLVGTDVTGAVGSSAEARFTLPARPFRNPLARAVLDVRRRLALGREQPAGAADDLQALGETPGELARDSTLFLNLSSTASLLRTDADGAARVEEASGRLWELALALEDGLHNDRAGARAALEVRAAQDRLSAQLEHMRQLGAKGQTAEEQSELQNRIAALSAAIARRMQALAAQAAHDHTTLPPMPDQSAMSGQDLSRMLQAMRDAAASGHAADAERQLSQMQAMLDHMRAATPQDLESAREQAAARQQARDQMEAVQDLVKRQSALLDRAQVRRGQAEQAQAGTQTDAQNNSNGEDAQPGGAGPGDSAMDPATRALMRQLGVPTGSDQADAGTGGGAAPDPGAPAAPSAEQQAMQQADRHAQHVLRRALDELSTEFKALTGKQADAFEDATRAMDRARDALGAGQDAPASAAQMQALAALQKGAQQMRSAMSGGSGNGSSGGGMALLPGEGPDSGGTRPGGDEGDAEAQADGDRDPLGRHQPSGHSGMDDGDATHVPDHAEPARSREIEQELRRRDSDRTRSQQELDYLDRLLKPF